MPKKFKSHIVAMTDKRLAGMLRPHAFKRCESCGASIISSECYCDPCKRLIEYRMAPALPQFKASNDTQRKQSHTAVDRSGYQDTIPNTKFPARRERVS